MSIRIAVVEDDAFTRLTLAAALRAQGIDVVLETESATEALREIPTLRLHAVFLDLHLGSGPTGVDLAVALRRIQPRLGIVLLTSFDDPRLLSTTLPDAPIGTQYVTKRSVDTIAVLIGALRDAVNATDPTTRTIGVADDETPRPPDDVISGLSALSDTQMETLRLVARGLSNMAIATQRGVSESAVESTIARLARHLGVAPDTALNQRVHLAQVYFRSLGMPLDER
jgi:DNA-binding NarL/FixJ family response regulator